MKCFYMKRKRNNEWIYSKMDRCFGNTSWFTMFPNVHQWFLSRFGSDHRPVLVKFMSDTEPFRGQFRFDKRWAEDPKVAEVIKEA